MELFRTRECRTNLPAEINATERDTTRNETHRNGTWIQRDVDGRELPSELFKRWHRYRTGLRKAWINIGQVARRVIIVEQASSLRTCNDDSFRHGSVSLTEFVSLWDAIRSSTRNYSRPRKIHRSTQLNDHCHDHYRATRYRDSFGCSTSSSTLREWFDYHHRRHGYTQSVSRKRVADTSVNMILFPGQFYVSVYAQNANTLLLQRPVQSHPLAITAWHLLGVLSNNFSAWNTGRDQYTRRIRSICVLNVNRRFLLSLCFIKDHTFRLDLHQGTGMADSIQWCCFDYLCMRLLCLG